MCVYCGETSCDGETSCCCGETSCWERQVAYEPTSAHPARVRGRVVVERHCFPSERVHRGLFLGQVLLLGPQRRKEVSHGATTTTLAKQHAICQRVVALNWQITPQSDTHASRATTGRLCTAEQDICCLKSNHDQTKAVADTSNHEQTQDSRCVIGLRHPARHRPASSSFIMIVIRSSSAIAVQAPCIAL